MKKYFLIACLGLASLTVKGQCFTNLIEFGLAKKLANSGKKQFSLGSANCVLGIDGYSTNYWFAAIVPYIQYAHSINLDRNVPDGSETGRISSPYRRTFSHPFHRFGNLAAGLTCSVDFEDFPIGFYGSFKYKTNEAFYNKLPKGKDNDRVHYINPELGLRVNFGDLEEAAFTVELGASYDAVLSYKGHVHDYDKDAVKSGFNAVVGIGVSSSSSNMTLKYVHPFYNFYNEKFSPDGGGTHPLEGFKYKIGQIYWVYRWLF